MVLIPMLVYEMQEVYTHRHHLITVSSYFPPCRLQYPPSTPTSEPSPSSSSNFITLLTPGPGAPPSGTTPTAIADGHRGGGYTANTI